MLCSVSYIDVVLINGGVIWGEWIYSFGYVFIWEDIFIELLFCSCIIVLCLVGWYIKVVLENGLS